MSMLTSKDLKKYNFELKIIQGGYQYIFGTHKITIYPSKSKKWNYKGDWFPYKGNDIEIVKSIIEKDKPVAPLVETNGGVQKCIDHLTKKAELIGKSNNQLATLLKTCVQELYQYL